MKKLVWFAIVFGTAILLSMDQAHAMVYLDSTGRPIKTITWGVPQVNRVPVAPTVRSGVGATGRPDWTATAFCESTGHWDYNTGNGYWGGLQFAPSTWFAYGGGPFTDPNGADVWGPPFPYSEADQIAVAERVLAAQGPGAWPSCFRWAS